MEQPLALLDQAKPWGLGRMRPYPTAAVLPAARPVLDPGTQVPVWVSPDGTPLTVEAKHKRSQTSQETSTKTSLDGNPDQGSDQHGDSD
ncbi:putative ATP-grasp-modified RiPP [Streptomyces echinatus]|uniref:Putative ATP-grasp target RiPP n=1 Tax=Streptomyces echinatus TaxID=67293 RepID=A0A7W9UNW3_9ACTN|nr:putative ATP-grasp-modified RiPP [Streptomyces echinatus]MBB5925306.1 putative ATP-grasp target RiPP [Streptomyces echinatus]